MLSVVFLAKFYLNFIMETVKISEELHATLKGIGQRAGHESINHTIEELLNVFGNIGVKITKPPVVTQPLVLPRPTRIGEVSPDVTPEQATDIEEVLQECNREMSILLEKFQQKRPLRSQF